MKYRAVRPLTLFAFAVVTACAEDTTAPNADVTLTPAESMTQATESLPPSGPWARIIEGETGPGSHYALFIPRYWNGDAISYAHGFRDGGTPIDLRDQDSFYAARDQLRAAGYAIAYSSFSANGFVVKDGAQRTHQLRGLLAARLGSQPARNFAMGHSLGGGIVLDLVQKFPDQYDGALMLCGMVGGSKLQTQYLGDVRALADVYFPGAFAGNAIGVPVGTVVTLGQVVGAVRSNPAGLFAIASMKQTPLPHVPVGSPLSLSSTAFQTLVGSLFGAVSFHARGINNVVDLVHGASPYGNVGTTYELGSTPLLPPEALAPAVAAANAYVTRYTLDNSASNYLDKYYTSTGALAVPVLTVHNTWDPAVPLFHETALKARVDAAGASSMLLQRQIPTFGHCAIPASTVVSAFNDLAGWASTGVRPNN